MDASITKLEKDFLEFHRANPEVYDLFRRFTLEALEAGHKKFSVSLVVERIRWETAVVTRTHDDFKINNNHRAYYARMFMNEFPNLKVFEVRITKGERRRENNLAHVAQ